jgi:hypothetical protein
VCRGKFLGVSQSDLLVLLDEAVHLLLVASVRGLVVAGSGLYFPG